MLIDFTVRNHRSIRDEQVFTFVPTNITELSETNTFETGLDGVERLLSSAVIYGANAAGKTSILDALMQMRSIVLHSADEEFIDADLPVTPFLLDQTRDEPTLFQVIFVREGTRYQYGFEATRRRVTEEWLYAFPEKRSQKLFVRKYNAETGEDEYQFGGSLIGRKAVWRSATRANALFLSTAAVLNSEQMTEIRRWFSSQIVIGHKRSPTETARLIQDDEIKEVAMRIMRGADIGIEDIRAREKSLEDTSVMDFIKSQVPPAVAKRLANTKTYDIEMLHRCKDGSEAWIDMSQESEGTRVLFAQVGPIISALSAGGVLIFDELNNNLHPILARAVVKLFHHRVWNRQNAQLLFTTHATSLLNTDILRRDQIWFAEKSSEGVTSFYPMTDFEPRKDASLAKHYLQGRFGAIPFIAADVWSDPEILARSTTSSDTSLEDPFEEGTDG